MKKLLLIFIVIFVMILTGCSSSTPTAVSTNTSPAPTEAPTATQPKITDTPAATQSNVEEKQPLLRHHRNNRMKRRSKNIFLNWASAKFRPEDNFL